MTIPVYDSVAFLASDTFAVFNAAGDSFVGAFAPGLRLRADCGTDGVLFGTVASSSHDAETGRTVVATAMDGGAALTANLAEVLHGNDVPESLCAHAALHAPGGRDALPAASTGVSGLVSLASAVETQAGASAAKAVTPAGLAAAVKGLITTNTTIYVATTGSDASGDGSSATPFASIHKALSSIAGKLIASGMTATIRVSDGTYSISSTITIDHPDADKIQIFGNTSAETTVPISAIDTTAKTITVTGNYTGSIQVGDIIGLIGSSTSGLNGAYVVSGVSYDGTNTVITCSAETIASATVGGGYVVIKACNRVIVRVVDINVFAINKPLKSIQGIRFDCSSPTSYNTPFNITQPLNQSITGCIVKGFGRALRAQMNGIGSLYNFVSKSCIYGPYAESGGKILLNSSQITIIDSCSNTGITSYDGGFVRSLSSYTIMRNNAANYSPALNTFGNNASYNAG